MSKQETMIGARNSSSIRKQLLGIGIVAAVGISLVMAGGLWQIAQLSGGIGEVTTIGNAIRNHMRADMMHDALRGDVFRAFLAESAQAGEQALNDLDAHATIFEASVAENRALALDPGIKEAITDADAALQNYVATTRSIATAAIADPQAARARLPELAEVFEDLEGRMETIGDRMEAVAANVRDASANRTMFSVATLLILAVATLVVVVLFLLWRSKQLVRRIEVAVDIAENIAQGEFDNAIDAGANDELGRLFSAMERMQSELFARLIAERNDAERVRRALEIANSSVMIVNEELEIFYVNRAAQQMMLQAQDDLRSALPGFDADRLVGTCIDQFHADARRVRDMLSALTGTQQSEIRLAGLTFKLTYSPVLDDAGTRIGTVMEWVNRTDEVRTENAVQEVVDAARAGDLSRRIDLSGRAGFFASLGQAINQLVGVAEQIVSDTSMVLSGLAEGDLSRTIERDYQGKFGELKSDVNATVARLTTILTEIKSSAEQISAGTVEISQGNSDLSRRTEQQASALEQTAASMEEMTSTVRRNAENASEANTLSTATRDEAERGGDVVYRAVEAMREINASSQKIADIIGVIDEIAFQTNLLALNAAVEAARAGEQGRGFAVVASEVRNLAQRSATAAKEIKELIEDSVDKVQNGSKFVDESGSTLKQIVDSVKKVTDIVAEIAAASQEQSQGIEQVTSAIGQMDTGTQQNAALVEQAAAASESMAEQAARMNEMVSFFKMEEQIAQHTQPADDAVYAGVERRRADRPWSDNSNKPETTEPLLATGTMDEDSDWQEF